MLRKSLVLLLLVVSSTVMAQEQVYTYVSHWTVPRADWAEFEKIAEQVRPAMEGFINDSTIIHWGVESAFVHHEGSRTHAIWFSSTSLGKLAKAQEGSTQGPPNAALGNVTGHHDHVFVSTIHGGRTSSTKTGYSSVAVFQLKPGQQDEWQSLMETYFKPFLDEQVQSGNVLLYDIGQEYTHTGDPHVRYIWEISPNADALDAANEAFGKLQKENPAMWEAITATNDRSAHTDRFNHVLAYGHK